MLQRKHGFLLLPLISLYQALGLNGYDENQRILVQSSNLGRDINSATLEIYFSMK